MSAPPSIPTAQPGLTVRGFSGRILLARHGETEWNRVGRRQGQLDSPLTANGRVHARAIAEPCAGLGVDAVFTSPLGRARTTAEIVARRLSVAAVVVDELAEVHHGDFAGLTNDDIEARNPGELARRADNKYRWAFPGGESYADAGHRAETAIDRVAASDTNAPVIVAHEMIGRMLLGSLLRLDPDEALQRSLPHGTLIETWPNQRRAEMHSS